MTTAKDLTFRIELEVGIDKESYRTFFKSSGSHSAGRAIPQTALENEHAWKSMRDGSIRANHGYVFEFVSPILWGEFGLVRVFTQMEDFNLDRAEWFVNSTMGFHLHIGASEFTAQELDRIVNAFKYYEHTFFGLNGEYARERWHNNFCKNSTRWGSIEETRYRSLNLVNVGKSNKNTIEFRLWRSTTDPKIVVAAVYLATALVTFARDNPFFDNDNLGTRPCLEGALDFIGIWNDPNCRIIEKEPADDVGLVLVRQCQEAHDTFFASLERRATW